MKAVRKQDFPSDWEPKCHCICGSWGFWFMKRKVKQVRGQENLEVTSCGLREAEIPTREVSVRSRRISEAERPDPKVSRRVSRDSVAVDSPKEVHSSQVLCEIDKPPKTELVINVAPPELAVIIDEELRTPAIDNPSPGYGQVFIGQDYSMHDFHSGVYIGQGEICAVHGGVCLSGTTGDPATHSVCDKAVSRSPATLEEFFSTGEAPLGNVLHIGDNVVIVHDDVDAELSSDGVMHLNGEAKSGVGRVRGVLKRLGFTVFGLLLVV